MSVLLQYSRQKRPPTPTIQRKGPRDDEILRRCLLLVVLQYQYCACTRDLEFQWSNILCAEILEFR